MPDGWPKTPCSPSAMPLSPTKITTVSSARPASSSWFMKRPSAASTARTSLGVARRARCRRARRARAPSRCRGRRAAWRSSTSYCDRAVAGDELARHLERVDRVEGVEREEERLVALQLAEQLAAGAQHRARSARARSGASAQRQEVAALVGREAGGARQRAGAPHEREARTRRASGCRSRRRSRRRWRPSAPAAAAGSRGPCPSPGSSARPASRCQSRKG